MSGSSLHLFLTLCFSLSVGVELFRAPIMPSPPFLPPQPSSPFVVLGRSSALSSLRHLSRTRPPFLSIVASASSEHAAYKSLQRTKKMRSIRIQIIEDVVRRVSDPSLEYHNKGVTTSDLRQLLGRLKTSSSIEIPAQTPNSVIVASKREAIEESLRRLRGAKVVPVLRGSNAQRLIERGLELSRMPGCLAIEVSVDCPDAELVIRELSAKLPPSCLLGAATVMCEEDFKAAAEAGAHFLTSPVAPPGMIDFCEQRGLLAIPAAMTPSEIFNLVAAGARAVKLFPAAATMGPEGLRCLLALKPFKEIAILASGGIGPGDVGEWLAAGAAAVAVGTQLVGKDTTLPSPPSARAQAAGCEEESVCVGVEEAEWLQKGRAHAMEVFARHHDSRCGERQHGDSE